MGVIILKKFITPLSYLVLFAYVNTLALTSWTQTGHADEFSVSTSLANLSTANIANSPGANELMQGIVDQVSANLAADQKGIVFITHFEGQTTDPELDRMISQFEREGYIVRLRLVTADTIDAVLKENEAAMADGESLRSLVVSYDPQQGNVLPDELKPLTRYSRPGLLGSAWAKVREIKNKLCSTPLGTTLVQIFNRKGLENPAPWWKFWKRDPKNIRDAVIGGTAAGTEITFILWWHGMPLFDVETLTAGFLRPFLWVTFWISMIEEQSIIKDEGKLVFVDPNNLENPLDVRKNRFRHLLFATEQEATHWTLFLAITAVSLGSFFTNVFWQDSQGSFSGNAIMTGLYWALSYMLPEAMMTSFFGRIKQQLALDKVAGAPQPWTVALPFPVSLFKKEISGVGAGALERWGRWIKNIWWFGIFNVITLPPALADHSAPGAWKWSIPLWFFMGWGIIYSFENLPKTILYSVKQWIAKRRARKAGLLGTLPCKDVLQIGVVPQAASAPGS